MEKSFRRSLLKELFEFTVKADAGLSRTTNSDLVDIVNAPRLDRISRLSSSFANNLLRSAGDHMDFHALKILNRLHMIDQTGPERISRQRGIPAAINTALNDQHGSPSGASQL
ncbi:hypothetical protein SH661x_002666 [Planctomicrobium sp. SH661]|uniref:hypothetical protein n=1 Tax=Planctomicrobium sp. SH661 TaxID=3448124 RepID=UPI003F5B20E1